MNDADHRHHHKADAHSGCGCSAKARRPPSRGSSCCGGHGASPQRSRDKGPRSRLRHERRSRDLKAPLRASRRDLPFLLGRLPHQIRCRSRKVSRKGKGARAGDAGGHDLHLPDASGDPPGRTRQLPDLRHGAGAGGREPGERTQSGARRHDAAVLDRRRAGAAACGAGDGWPSRRARTTGSTRLCRTGSSSSLRRPWWSGPAGRSSSAAGSRC